MGKALYISEKPSVAKEFAKALHMDGRQGDGYLESQDAVVTWCVGHLVTMSYPEKYDPAYKKWELETLPFLPDKFLYEVIPSVSKQFQVVKGLLNRKDIDTIYVCTDSGREGEYIYRLVDEMAKVPDTKEKRRVWIDSQTEEEILRGIQEAKPLSAYDKLSSAAYLRAKEDYLMGINFSRVLTLKYGQSINSYLRNKKWSAISVGRVMTCVLGMVVRREQEIRDFVKTPFYRVLGTFGDGTASFVAEWRAVEGSRYFGTPFLYKENGFKERKTAEELVRFLTEPESSEEEGQPRQAVVEKVERKKENKQPPLLFNLAELQNTCSRLFKISPDETLKIAQELYEKKLVTYPRTDARVLSTAVSKEIHKNLSGLRNYAYGREYAEEILAGDSYKKLARTKYVNDKQITDHYAIIPTGQGLGALQGVSATAAKVYEIIARRFLSIFYPPAVYRKTTVTLIRKGERFFASFRVLEKEGYLKLAKPSFQKKKEAYESSDSGEGSIQGEKENGGKAEEGLSPELSKLLASLKKGSHLTMEALEIKEGETSPPKRYSSGSMILAMENAGQLIEDEELRAQIKGSGIGTSATRAEILNKLVNISYLGLNKKTQVITPTLQGELVYHVVNSSIRSLLNPELTASWEKGLNYVAEGTIAEEEYMQKLEGFIQRLTDKTKGLHNQAALLGMFNKSAAYYDTKAKRPCVSGLHEKA